MTHREFKLSEKRRQLERNTRRFLKLLANEAALGLAFPEPDFPRNAQRVVAVQPARRIMPKM